MLIVPLVIPTESGSPVAKDPSPAESVIVDVLDSVLGEMLIVATATTPSGIGVVFIPLKIHISWPAVGLHCNVLPAPIAEAPAARFTLARSPVVYVKVHPRAAGPPPLVRLMLTETLAPGVPVADESDSVWPKL